MALQRDARYPGRWTAASGGHPQGAFKNRSAPGALDGSYIEQDWANDWDGFFGSLLTASAITANGTVDAVGASQYFAALTAVIDARPTVKKVVRQVFTGSGTYTPSAGMVYCEVELVGGGGGGGGCTGGAGSSTGGGGGAGGYIKKVYPAATIGTTRTITIGAAGTAGNAAGAGGAGGSTIVVGLLTAGGGNGGTAGVSGTVIALSGSGGIGGTATGGDINIPGDAGGPGLIFGSTNGGLSGFGGGSQFSARAAQSGPTGNGQSPTGRGAGGSGGSCTSVSTVGAAGTAGLVVITEYCAQ